MCHILLPQTPGLQLKRQNKFKNPKSVVSVIFIMTQKKGTNRSKQSRNGFMMQKRKEGGGEEGEEAKNA